MKKEILTDWQKEVLKAFGQIKFGRNFYWTGGTLLSSEYFNHRLSLDLDFFSKELYRQIEYIEFSQDLKKILKLNKINFRQDKNRFIFILKKGDNLLKIELVYFPFPAIKKRLILKEYNIKKDSLIDLMTNKVLASYQREEIKDVYDLYFYLTKKQGNLSKLIKLVEKKFGVDIEITLLLGKINKTIEKLSELKPLLIQPEKNLLIKMKSYFQQQFNLIIKRQIK